MKHDLNIKLIMERLKLAREAAKLSYQDVAALTGLSKSTLQRYETGNIKKIPLSKVNDLADALNVSPAYLLGWDKIEADANNDNSLDNESEKLFKSLSDEKKKQALDFLRFLQGE